MHHDSLLIRIKVKSTDCRESLQEIAVFEMRTSEVEESSELMRTQLGSIFTEWTS